MTLEQLKETYPLKSMDFNDVYNIVFYKLNSKDYNNLPGNNGTTKTMKLLKYLKRSIDEYSIIQ